MVEFNFADKLSNAKNAIYFRLIPCSDNARNLNFLTEVQQMPSNKMIKIAMNKTKLSQIPLAIFA